MASRIRHPDAEGTIYWLLARMNDGIKLSGEIDGWPSQMQIHSILSDAGIGHTVKRYSIDVLDCEDFVFQDCHDNTGDPSVVARGSDLAALLRDARRVSSALAAADVRHRFELYNGEDRLVGYLHHNWPR